MSQIRSRAVLTMLLLAGAAAGTPARVQVPDPDAEISEADLVIELPERRRFRMGFAYQPYDWTQAAFTETFELIARHGDLVTIYQDTGVPWPEALAGRRYHPNFEAELERRRKGISAEQSVVFVASFLGLDRTSLAPYAGKEDPAALPGKWKNRSFDHPEVFAAFMSYCREMIRRFRPDYFGYVAEVDAALTDVDDPRFQKLLGLARRVYTTLKKEYPELPVFIEFNLGDAAYMHERRGVIAALLPYTDIYAVSTYPAHYDQVFGHATRVPEDWFSRVTEIAPGKPFAIVETAFLAEDFMHPTLGVRMPGKRDRLLIPGGESSHALYTKLLLEEAQRLDAVFVNQWAVRDLDQLFAKLARAGGVFSEPMWRLVEDTGLYDETGRARRARAIWDAWLDVAHASER